VSSNSGRLRVAITTDAAGSADAWEMGAASGEQFDESASGILCRRLANAPEAAAAGVT
jgi:hypothetical protein